MLQIDSSKVKGEPGTGYEAEDGRGPFNCENCNYFADGACRQETMKKVSRQPRTADGLVKVDPKGCCEYVERRASKRQAAYKAAHDAAKRKVG